MSRNWKITASANHDRIEEALLAHEDALDWDHAITLSAHEEDEAADRWRLEAWLPREPGQADVDAVAALFTGPAPELHVEAVADADWVVASQAGLEPIRAGRFHVRTPDYPRVDEPGVIDFTIPASQAFGTGHHETTAGCLAMLDRMRRQGVVVRNGADVGTGTGLLAFAALRLWPRAIMTASDIDPVSAMVTIDNAALNGLRVGARGGEVTVTVADGMDHPLIEARGPYDLVMANILAGPLVEMAPDFAAALVPGGSLLLSGLMTSQEPAVLAACRRAGLRLAAREARGNWSILWLRRRPVLRAAAGRRARRLPGTARW